MICEDCGLFIEECECEKEELALENNEEDDAFFDSEYQREMD